LSWPNPAAAVKTSMTERKVNIGKIWVLMLVSWRPLAAGHADVLMSGASRNSIFHKTFFVPIFPLQSA
jgi:hypothetical protein